jgi:tryptophan synthase alpha chain
MNRIDNVFKEKRGNILSVYFTAGFPALDSTVRIAKALENSGADMIEIGMPFSDPMADGPVIQHSNDVALRNGMSLKLLFEQLKNFRNEVRIPVLLMGYLNPVIQFGIENFCRKCSEAGIDGVILPDLPPDVYDAEYRDTFQKHNLYNILLISPQSSGERIHEIDAISRGFIYMVSSSAVTGGRRNFSDVQLAYFSRVSELGLRNPQLIGFGISDHETFADACHFSAGGIIGSAFVKMLDQEGESEERIRQFVTSIRE